MCYTGSFLGRAMLPKHRGPAQKPWSTGGGGSEVRPLLWFPGEELVSRVRRLEWASLNHSGGLWAQGCPALAGPIMAGV